MKKSRIKSIAVCLLAAALTAASLAGCGGSGSSSSSSSSGGSSSSAQSGAGTASTDPDKLVIGIYDGLDSLNPWTSGRITKDMVTYVCYETLASQQSGATEIDSIMMKSYEQEDDYTWNIEIYDYITDAEGNNITADDVVFSFNQYMTNWATTVDTIEATGDYTVKLTLNTAAEGAFNYITSKVPIASETAYNNSPDQFATTSCGTTAYVCKGGEDYVNGTTITLRSTGSYWQTDESLIYGGSVIGAETIEYDILQEATQLALAVEQGNVDIAFYVNSSLVDEVGATEGIGLLEMTAAEERGIMFWMGENSPFYDNLELRQAVLYAIDNDAVAEACGYGHGKGSTVTCGQDGLTIGYNPEWEISPYKYDPEKAKELVAASGYNGETIRLLCNSNSVITMMWQIVQAELLEVGINAEIVVVEGTTYGTYRDGSNGQYDMAYAGVEDAGYVTADLWNTLFNRNNYASGHTWADYDDDKLQELYDAIAAPGGYTQDNLDAFYDYITDNALYYNIYFLSEYAAYNEARIGEYFTDWNRFIRANTIQLK